MRQVPQYLIIGNGRVARHFCHYFTLLNLPFHAWHRKHPLSELHHLKQKASHILLLIHDDAIETFASQHLQNCNAIKIHFSGSLISASVYGAHPLTTFNQHLYDLATYQTIPFIFENHAPPFETLLPGLSNPYVSISAADKPKYHALCVLSGNFSCMLWQKLMRDFERDLHISANFSHAYLKQITDNLVNHYEDALTGPLMRDDKRTIQRNLQALEDDPFHTVYESFVQCYQKINGTKT